MQKRQDQAVLPGCYFISLRSYLLLEVSVVRAQLELNVVISSKPPA